MTTILKVKAFITETLNIDTENIHFDEIFRIATRSGVRPIFVRFAYLKERDHVLATFRAKRRDGELDVRVGEDLPSRIARARSGLYPLLQQCFADGKRAHFRYDKLVVGDEQYQYDEKLKKPVRVEP